MKNQEFSKRLEMARAKTKKLPKLGTGERFAKLKKTLEKKPGVKDAGGLAAWIGRKKFGNKKFAALSKEGKKA